MAAGSIVGSACAQSVWREEFEAAQTSWRAADSDAQYRIAQQARVQGEAHGGRGSEWLRIEAGGGSYIFLAQDIGRPRVIEELAPSIWVKADRAGLTLALRVVLPRTTDPRTNGPLATTIAGPAYSDAGRWQRLQMDGLPKLVQRQVHILRMELGPQVDDREAYVEAVLLNAYCGPGTTNVWIDDLEVAGHASAFTGPALGTPQGAPADPNVVSAGPLVPVRLPPVDSGSQTVRPLPPVGNSYVASRSDPMRNFGGDGARPPAAPRRNVKLVGSILMVDGRPMFPRIIQHRGESLAALKQLGFNAVWLHRLPAPELLEEADRLGIWLICPPPRPMPTEEQAAGATAGGMTPVAAMADIGPQFDCVLAWDLGGDLTDADVNATQHWAEQVQTADRRGKRPLVCQTRTNLRAFSRSANILLIDRRPVGTTLEMSAYADWVRKQPLLASLGTPVWTTVQTQPNEAVRQQLVTLEPGNAPPLSVAWEQMQLIACTAVASGSRGLVFVSDSPLDSPDPETRQRAMALELLNLELGLLEPWAAAGSCIATAESNLPQVTGAVMRTEHSRLLLPLWSSPGGQFVPEQSAANSLMLVAPGVPESSSAYELTPGGVQSLRHMRVAGGMSVTLDEFGLASEILLAQDPLIISAVHHQAARTGQRAAELQRHLAVQKYNTVQAVAAQLATRTQVQSFSNWLASARKSLQLCDRQLTSGDSMSAALNAQRAMRSLRLIERAYWDGAVKGLVSPITSPASVSFNTLPCHWRLIDRLNGCHFSQNQVAGGDFEDIGTMMRTGWRYILHPSPTVQANVELLPQAARSGRLGVRLLVTPTDPKNPPAVVESPPIFFSSPSVQVEAGQLVCIHGWAHVPAPITASCDGLLVVDSATGEALADRIGPTKTWRHFAMYRVVPQTGPMCVTFALSGIGEAWLDDVSIQIVERSPVLTQR